MTRCFLRSVCRVLIGVVLLAQLAVSAYACPALSLGSAINGPMASTRSVDGAGQSVAGAIDQHAADCAGMAGAMDPEFANLCAAHCHYGQQSDQAATLTVPAALFTALYFVTPLAPAPAAAPRAAADTPRARAGASPPLAIQHCCFRI